MKIEKIKPAPKVIVPSQLLRDLKPLEAIRISTAASWRQMAGCINPVARETKKKFITRRDGDDVLVYLDH